MTGKRAAGEPPAGLVIRALAAGEHAAVIELWRRCGLLRPWNEPRADIERCRAAPSGELFVGLEGGWLCAALMCGGDGHRGWLYYLAVDPARRRRGYGRAMVRHAEGWLAAAGVPKVELMVRPDNREVTSFYERLGYAVEPRVVLARWMAGHDGAR